METQKMTSIEYIFRRESIFSDPSGQFLCKNSIQVEHFVLSVLGHLAIQILRQWNERQRFEYSRAFYLLFHYGLLWISVLTSPKGIQLDFWLLIVAALDIIPIILGLYKAMTDLRSESDEEMSFRELSELTMSGEMRQWSPAFVINESIMVSFEGCFFSHAYLLFWIMTFISSFHSLVVKNMYCYEVRI